jgi:hypothetical protein
MITVSSASALITANALNSATFDANKASERISTGKRINRASDDPSGLIRALTMKSDIGSYTKALENINAGTEAMDKIATALASIYEILTEMKSLTTSAQLTSATDDDVAAYQARRFDGAPIGVFTHRIIDGDGESGWILKGDNNPSPDIQKPKNNDILGVVIFVIPWLGNLLSKQFLFTVIPLIAGMWFLLDTLRKVPND